MERIDKILAKELNISRKEVKRLVKNKGVTLNGNLVKSCETKCNPELDSISVNGRAVEYRPFVYIMMNKPSGVLSATEDKKEKTVIDLLPEDMKRRDLFPVGRLDKDTEGLLIISDDGDFAHKILSPKNHVPKVYQAHLDKDITEDDIKAFKEGIVFRDGTKCKSAVLKNIGEKKAEVTITEGKFHQVKKMFLSVGKTVLYLKRIKMGNIELDENLPKGQSRYLTETEKETIIL